MLSVIRHLPPEILQLLFVHLTELLDEKDSLTDIWSVSHVCQSWRSNALAVARIWARFPVINLNDSAATTARQLALLTELTTRSRNAPLAFRVKCWSFNAQPADSQSVLEFLATFCERWQDVSLDMPLRFARCLDPIKGRIPQLHSVALSVPGKAGEMDGPFDLFGDAPRLRRVYLGGFVDTHPIILPYPQLHSFQDFRCSPVFIERFLQLETPLALRFLSISGSGDITLPRVKLPHLTHLLVVTNSLHKEYASELILPAIEEITYVAEHNIYPQILRNIISNCGTEPCTLTRLSLKFELHGQPMRRHEFLALLTLVPLLVHLDVAILPHDDISKMAFGYKGQPVVPLIESCRFFIPKSWMFTADHGAALNDLVQSRFVGDSSALERPNSITSGIRLQTRTLKTVLVYSYEIQVPSSRYNTILNVNSDIDDVSSSLSGSAYESLWKMVNKHEKDMCNYEYMKAKEQLEEVEFEKWLTNVEKLDLTNGWDVYLNRAHIELRRLSEWEIMIENSEYAKVFSILDQWNALLLRDVAPYLRWAYQGKNCEAVVYIPPDSSRLPMDIVYSLPEDEPIFWFHKYRQ